VPFIQFPEQPELKGGERNGRHDETNEQHQRSTPTATTCSICVRFSSMVVLTSILLAGLVGEHGSPTTSTTRGDTCESITF
jgi:hypothetical protein